MCWYLRSLFNSVVGTPCPSLRTKFAPALRTRRKTIRRHLPHARLAVLRQQFSAKETLPNEVRVSWIRNLITNVENSVAGWSRLHSFSSYVEARKQVTGKSSFAEVLTNSRALCDNHMVAPLFALSTLSRDLLTAHRGSARHNEALPLYRGEWQPLVRVLSHREGTPDSNRTARTANRFYSTSCPTFNLTGTIILLLLCSIRQIDSGLSCTSCSIGDG